MESRKEKIGVMATPAARWALAGGLAVWTAIGFAPSVRPDPVAAGAPGVEFSAERAMTTVRAIAQRPHPVGSVDHDRVRDYILAEFTRLGVTPGRQAGIGSYRRTGKAENIVARLPGTANTRPVMLAAHYDSTRRGPGAGDDAHGVAVLLETLRALRESAPLRNDVIFLVTDGEEDGMLGAALFMRDHPWHAEPGVVLNFEARGTGGAATMFETSTPNEWMVRALRTAVPAANATSFAYEVYRRMPNDTDLSVFKRNGLAGMNFAFIEHPEWYHRPQDDPAHLDLRSVQEQGNYALALARLFGAHDLNQPQSGDAVYFPTRLTPLIIYSTAWVQPLAWLIAVGLVMAALAGWRRRMRGFWFGFVLAIPAILLLMVAKAAPGVTYILEWPLALAVIAYAVWMTAPRVIGADWRLGVLLLCPAASFLLIAPMLRELIVALGPRTGGVIVAVAVLWMLITVFPQVRLTLAGGGRERFMLSAD
jgi:Peptidase family M28